jgi:DNA-binding SARP family transcriptional activator
VGLSTGPQCWVDVEAFTATVRAAMREPPARAAPATAAALEAGLALYAGELMAGLDEEWLEPERRHLAELQQAALAWLVRHHAASGRAEAAVEAARRLLRQDPLREDIHRELMLLHEALGQRGQALRQYDYCRDVLASELGVTPMPETEALHRRLLQAGPRPSPAGEAGRAALPTDRGLLVAMLGQVRALERLLERALGAPTGGLADGGRGQGAATAAGPKAPPPGRSGRRARA